MTEALLAGAAMLVSDVLETIKVMAQAKERGWTAGLVDTVYYYAVLATNAVALKVLWHDSIDRVALVLAMIGIANIVGMKLGQITGHALLRRSA